MKLIAFIEMCRKVEADCKEACHMMEIDDVWRRLGWEESRWSEFLVLWRAYQLVEEQHAR